MLFKTENRKKGIIVNIYFSESLKESSEDTLTLRKSKAAGLQMDHT